MHQATVGQLPKARDPFVDGMVDLGTLGLTPAESQVAVSLAEGQSVRDMAEATGHAIYWHLTPIYMKRVISRQADRVR